MCKVLSYRNIFNPNNSPVQQGRYYIPFYIWGNGSPEMLRDPPKDIGK